MIIHIVLFSSLGMSTAMDFVLGWTNRNGSHSWNVLIVNGVSYPFEPFWDADRWKYKRDTAAFKRMGVMSYICLLIIEKEV